MSVRTPLTFGESISLLTQIAESLFEMDDGLTGCLVQRATEGIERAWMQPIRQSVAEDRELLRAYDHYCYDGSDAALGGQSYDPVWVGRRIEAFLQQRAVAAD